MGSRARLLEEAKSAISRVFSDTSISVDDKRESLEELQKFIKEKLEAL